MLFRNTAAQAAPQLVGYLFSFALAPLLLSRIGLAAFGVWAVTGALATYAWVLDFGIRRSLSRFIAVYDADGDRHAIAECVELGLLLVAVVWALAAVGSVLAAPLVSEALGRVVAADDMRVVLLCASSVAACNGLASVLNSVGTGMRRMVPPNVALLIGMCANFVLSVAALAVSRSLVVYAIANAAAGLLGVVAAAVALLYLWGSIPLAFPSRSRAREILAFGLRVQAHWLADLVNLQTDKVLIGLLVDVRAAAAYEVAARATIAFRSAALLTVSAMIPTAAAHIARHGRDAVSEWYRRYSRRVVALAFPLLAFACAGAPFLLKAWLGEIPGDGAAIMAALSAAYFVNVTTEVGRTTATADGRPELVARNSLFTAGLNVAATALLAPAFGMWGVLAGTFAALALGTALFHARFHRVYRVPVRVLVDAVVPPAALSIALAAPLLLLRPVTGALESSRATAVAAAAGIALAYGLSYWIAAGRLHYLPERLILRPRPASRRQET